MNTSLEIPAKKSEILATLFNEVFAGKAEVGHLAIRQRMFENEIIAKEAKLKQLIEDEIATSGLTNVVDYGYDGKAGKVYVVQKDEETESKEPAE